MPPDYYATRFQFAVIGGYTHDCYLYGDGSLWGGKLQNDTDYRMATRGLDPKSSGLPT